MPTPWHFVKAKREDMVWLVIGIPIVFGRTAFLMPREVARAAILGQVAAEAVALGDPLREDLELRTPAVEFLDNELHQGHSA